MMQLNTHLLVVLFALTTVTINPLQAQSDIELGHFYLGRARDLYSRSLYDSLAWYYNQASKIYQETDYPEGTAECILGLSEYYRLSNDLELAETSLDTAMGFIKANMGFDSETWSDALYVLAKLRWSQNRLPDALDIISECLDLREKLHVNPEKLALAQNVKGSVYHYLGDYINAESFYLPAYNFFEAKYPDPTVEKGWLQFNLGVVYGRLGKMDKWLAYTKLAIDNNIELFGRDFADLAVSFSGLASYYILDGRLDSARYYLDRAEDIYISTYGKDYYNLDEIYINRARILTLEGNYYTALEYYHEVERLHASHGQVFDWQSYIQFLNTAHLYRQLGQYEDAQVYYDKLLNAEEQVHSSRMTVFYRHLAINHTSLGNFNLADKYFLKVNKGREAYYPMDYYGKVVDLAGYGVLLDSLGRYKEASEYFLQALDFAKDYFGPFHPSTSKYHKFTGDHFLRMGDAAKALGYYQESLRSLIPGYDINYPENNPTQEEVQDYLFYLGLLKKKAESLELLAAKENGKGFLEAAFQAYRLSVNITSYLRNSYLNDQSKLYLSGNERETYESLVRCAFELYERDNDPFYMNEAFIAVEKAKYATLVSVLQRSGALQLAGIPDSVQNMEASLQREMAVYRELLIEAQSDTIVDSSRVQQYRSAIFLLSDRIEKVNQELEGAYPEYYRLLYNQSIADPVFIRNNLGRNEKLLEYFMSPNYLYIIEISDRISSFRCIPLDSIFLGDIQTIDKFLKSNYSRDSVSISHEEYLKAAHRMYEKLIPGSYDAKRLLIVPEGKLAYFPFDILISENIDDFNGKYSEIPFLIKDHSLQYSYSSTLLHSTIKRKNNGGLVAFAPGYIETGPGHVSQGAIREMKINRSDLAPLPGTLKEVSEIGKMTGGKVLTGAEANETNFMQWAPSSKVLHLATHAFIDDEDPLFSKLVFSEEPGGGEDGYLNVYEIYNLKLQASMVVLSACNTGAGIMKGGEGIMSLARAFLYAGVPNIVMTLWTVSDEKSNQLMREFYRHLLKGKTTSEALRRAKLAMLTGEDLMYQNPQYWSGYISVGDNEAIFKPVKFIILLMVILSSGILLFIGQYRRNNRMKG
jgi:CHAT domain-containing protein